MNFISAVAWVVVFTTAGYFLGSALEALLNDIKKYEIVVMLAIASLGGIIWILYLIIERIKKLSFQVDDYNFRK